MLLVNALGLSFYGIAVRWNPLHKTMKREYIIAVATQRGICILINGRTGFVGNASKAAQLQDDWEPFAEYNHKLKRIRCMATPHGGNKMVPLERPPGKAGRPTVEQYRHSQLQAIPVESYLLEHVARPRCEDCDHEMIRHGLKRCYHCETKKPCPKYARLKEAQRLEKLNALPT